MKNEKPKNSMVAASYLVLVSLPMLVSYDFNAKIINDEYMFIIINYEEIISYLYLNKLFYRYVVIIIR